MKKRFHIKLVMGMAAVMTAAMLLPCAAEAANFEAGHYSKRYKDEGFDEPAATYVSIKKAEKDDFRFQVGYVGFNASPIYETQKLKGKVKDGKVKFQWQDTWGNSGSGILKPGDGFVKLKMVEEQKADVNRATLDTNGKFLKLKRRDD